MKVVVCFFPVCTLMLMSIISAYASPASTTCPIPSTNKPIPTYFKEMNKILKLLSVFEPYSDARPANATFERSAKRLFKLGKTIDQASQVLMQQQKGNLDQSDVKEIDASLQLSAKYVVNITELVKYGKPLSDKYNYTTMNVQIIQGVTSQYTVLFEALIAHIPKSAYPSIGHSISVIICALVEAMDFLQPGAFAKGGKEYCDQFDKEQQSSTYPEEALCIFTPPAVFTQCGNSSTAMFNYGMDNNLMGKPQTSEWCPSNSHPNVCKYHPSCAFTQ